MIFRFPRQVAIALYYSYCRPADLEIPKKRGKPWCLEEEVMLWKLRHSGKNFVEIAVRNSSCIPYTAKESVLDQWLVANPHADSHRPNRARLLRPLQQTSQRKISSISLKSHSNVSAKVLRRDVCLELVLDVSPLTQLLPVKLVLFTNGSARTVVSPYSLLVAAFSCAYSMDYHRISGLVQGPKT